MEDSVRVANKEDRGGGVRKKQIPPCGRDDGLGQGAGVSKEGIPPPCRVSAEECVKD